MKVLLIFPPQGQPFIPHPAVPLLTAVLKKEGIEVQQRDYNLESYEYFLSPEKLKEHGVLEFVANQIDYQKKFIRSGRDYLYPLDYYNAVGIIDECLSKISSFYSGSHWSLKTYTCSYSFESTEEILKSALDYKNNLFYPFFEEKIKEIKEYKPDLVGISVSWHNQLIPAFVLSAIIRAYLPDIHVCLGGSMISHLANILQYKRKIFAIIDSLIVFEGEKSLVALVKNLKEKKFENVPGLIYHRGKKVLFNPPQPVESLEEVPIPDFDGFPLDRYYSPQTYLPISASRGCYWGKCAFCSHHYSGFSFRQDKAERIFDIMKGYHRKYGCKNFYFVDDALPPTLIHRLSQLIWESGDPFRWAGEIRMEKNMDEEYFKTLYKGGCRMLLFGMESYCQKTLDKMKKGWQKEVFRRGLKHASKAGIMTWVFFFLGFPGESVEDAEETLDFLVNYRKYIDMIAGGKFVLTRNSPIFLNPKDYGIEEYREEKDKDLSLTFSYKSPVSLPDKALTILLAKFRRDPRVSKFLEPFVSEPHLLFFKKSYFQAKFQPDRK